MKFHALPTVAAGLALAACVTDAPTTPDTDDPHIMMSFSNGARATIRTSDERTDPSDQCLTVQGESVDVQATITDGGGLRVASISALGEGSIDESSINVSPDAPDVSFSFEDAARDSIIIRLTPPATGSVRTGVVVEFTVNGPFPVALSADARDYAGNQVVLEQFDLRGQADGVACIGG